MATRNGSAEWRGDLKGGDGDVTVGEGVYTGAFSFKSRFEDGDGTNPEELLAAAHAACFSMQMSALMGQDDVTPEAIRTTAKSTLRNVDGAPTITAIELETEGTVPGIDQDAFQAYADKAKETCVVSRALAGVGEMSVTARLT